MSGFIQDNGENRFANGVSHCDLRVHSDAAERDSRNKAEEFPAPPIGKLLGMTITKIGNGQDSVELQADERHANPMGTIHGGVFCDIADAVMGLAYRCTLAESESLTTIELKINFLRPVKFLT
jgi:acyl-coenzyme A thioesterase PaaI-like protein